MEHKDNMPVYIFKYKNPSIQFTVEIRTDMPHSTPFIEYGGGAFSIATIVNLVFVSIVVRNGDGVTSLPVPQNETSIFGAEANEQWSHIPQLTALVTAMANGFDTNQLYIYYDRSLKTDIVERIVLHLNAKPVTLLDYDMTKPIPYVNDDYVKTFHINVLHDVSATNDDDDGVTINLSYVRELSADKYNSHFILVIERALERAETDAWAQQAFAQFWQKNVYNALIVFAQHMSGVADLAQLRVLTFNPFLSTNGGLVELAAARTAYEHLFWDKAQNLFGAPFRVSLFGEQTRARFDPSGTELVGGTDALLTKLMVERMNATLVLLPPDDGFDIGEFLHGGGATGSLAQVLTGAVHVSFNTRFLRLSQFRGKIQITHTNGRDDICFMVPTAGYASNLYNIIRAFSPTVWFMTIGALLAVPLAFVVLDRVQPEPQPLRHAFLSFYSWHLAQPIMRLPAHWATKLLIAVWILYCLLITSSYQGNLTSNLVLRPTLPEINTIRQLDRDARLEILTFGRYVNLLLAFMNSTDEYTRLPHSIRSVSTGAELEQMVNAHDTRYAYANKQHINAYLVHRKGNIVHNRPLYHRVAECPVPFLVAYALRIGSPYLGRVNALLRAAQENGLTGLWDSQAEETLGAGERSGTGDGPVALTLDHMQSPFYILGLGLVLGLIGMLVELGVDRWAPRNLKNGVAESGW